VKVLHQWDRLFSHWGHFFQQRIALGVADEKQVKLLDEPRTTMVEWADGCTSFLDHLCSLTVLLTRSCS
jgi:hypothetical protein